MATDRTETLTLELSCHPMKTLKNVVVICTKNRPKLVAQLLTNLNSQKLVADLVLVVNGGSDPIAAELPVASALNYPLEVIDTEPGLTRQRNVALRHVANRVKYVHFFDDDVYLQPGYLHEISNTLDLNSRIAGATGDIVNARPKTPSLLERIFLLKSKRGGVVLSSGVNIGLPGVKTREPIMWLPGCAMSYRTSAIADTSFDESRTGYALGEDVDFSARLGLNAPLAFVPTAIMEHRFEPRDRVNSIALAQEDVVSRWKLAETLPFVHKSAVAFSTVGHAASYYLTSFSHENSWRRKAATLRLKKLAALVFSSSK